MKTNKCKPDVRLGINLLGNLGTKSFPSMHQSNILKMWIKFYYYSIFAKLELQPEGSHFLIKNTCKNSMRGELLWRFNDKVICSNWNYQKIVNFCYSSILDTTTYCLMPKKNYTKKCKWWQSLDQKNKNNSKKEIMCEFHLLQKHWNKNNKMLM